MRNYIFRVNAGLRTGLGHLSRCLNIAREISPCSSLTFFVKTDDENVVNHFLKKVNDLDGLEIIICNHVLSLEKDVTMLIQYVKEKQAYLILDHYDVTEDYQLALKKAGVHWLQLDSHANQKFYGDYVLHGSPGAIMKLYKNLRGSDETQFLLGPEYVLVGKRYRELHGIATVRKRVSRVLLSFGGGYAKGALLKYVPELSCRFRDLTFCVIVRGEHPDISNLRLLANQCDHLELCVDCENIPDLMFSCDFGILAPGGMSYEAATLGLPLLLIALEDNQEINLKGCSAIGIAQSLGMIENVSANDLCLALENLISQPSQLQEMSSIALKLFDGQGARRIGCILNNK